MTSITLIGMPGSGKSTIGKIIAKSLNWKFIDLDILILEKEGVSHEKILKNKGRTALLELENQHTLGLDLPGIVFSPGGSIIYSPEAMEKLKKETEIIFLDVPLEELKKRLGANPENARGIVDFEKLGWDGLFAQRMPVLKSFAHHIIDCALKNPEEITYEIIQHKK